MPDPGLLGCPHCGKPIAFAAELAGRLASCPHCRGAFQMPASAPPARASSAPPTKPPPANLSFDADAPLIRATVQRNDRREPVAYGNAEFGSLLVAVSGTIVSVALGMTIAFMIVLPLFQLPGVQTFALALLWSLGAIAVIVGGIAGSWLIRHLVLIYVDNSRNRTVNSPETKK